MRFYPTVIMASMAIGGVVGKNYGTMGNAMSDINQSM